MYKSLLYSVLTGVCLVIAHPAVAEERTETSVPSVEAEAALSSGSDPEEGAPPDLVTQMEALAPGDEVTENLSELLERAKKYGFGEVIEQNGRKYYAVVSRAQQGEAYTTYYVIRDNMFSGRVIVLREALAEKPGCHPEAETCVTVRLAKDEAALSFNLKGATQSYAYSGPEIRESGYFSQAAEASTVNVGELASDFQAAGLSQVAAWGPLPYSMLPSLATADLSTLGMAVGQSGIHFNNWFEVDPTLFEPTDEGLILKAAQKWEFGKTEATLAPLISHLDFNPEGILVKAAFSGKTQALQAEADETCLALTKKLGPAAATMVQKAGENSGRLEIHSWWWLDRTLSGLLRCTTVDVSGLGGPEKTLVAYTLNEPVGNFAPVLLSTDAAAPGKGLEALQDAGGEGLELP